MSTVLPSTLSPPPAADAASSVPADALAQPAPAREAERQRVRFTRYLMAAASTALTLAVIGLQMAMGVLPPQAAAVFAGSSMLAVAVFAVCFGTGFNRRFADPSLTVAQMLWAGASLTYLAYAAPAVRPLLLPFYLMVLFFGAFRLTTRQLLAVGAAFAAGDGLAVMLDMLQREARPLAALRRELVPWGELLALIVWFAWIGGYVSRLRARLQSTNAELREALQKIEVIAAYDELTGVCNRRSIREILLKERKRCDRNGQALCVAMIDADHFKHINDRYGHAAGDEVLRTLGRVLRASLRDTDAVGRYGGEEFLVVLPVADAAQAATPLERIRSAVAAARFKALPAELQATVSIGVAEYRRGEDADEAVKRADAAVYAAKAQGRNRIVWAAADDAPHDGASA
jgi:diguanylate cyclase (GGDEF)-like protein